MKERDSYRGVRVLVLGGAGFIGRWVAARLAAGGAQVVVAARDTARARDVLLRHEALCRVQAHDCSRPGSAALLLNTVRPAITFNLVGYGVDPRERDEAPAWRSNAELVEELAAAVAPDPDWGGQALIHVGSALEFGTLSGDFADPWDCAPTTLYGRTKLAGSEALRDVSQRRGVRALTARLFTVYGPGEHPARLLPSLLAARASRADLPLTLGTQQRDFTYVADVGEGLIRLGLLREALPERALNLATGVQSPVREFVETAARVLGIESTRLAFGALPTRPEEMSHEPVSLAALERAVAWRPTTTIEAGVRETLAFELHRGPA